MTEKTLRITKKAEPKLWFGDHFYCVNISSSRLLAPTCPVCGGSKRIKVKGKDKKEYLFDCYFCTSPFYNATAHDYDVFEYVVNGVHVQGANSPSSYKDRKAIVTNVISLTAICITDSFLHSYLLSLRPDSFEVIDNAEMAKMVTDKVIGKTPVFLDRELANIHCQAMKDAEEKRLKAINKDLEYPF